MLSKTAGFGNAVTLAIVLFQLVFWNSKSYSVNAEDESPLLCPGSHFREYCTEEKPCCFYDGINHTCQEAKDEGELCTVNSVAFNTRACFCKVGLFCIDNKCTKEKPKFTMPENSFEPYKK
ncbi:uncharacterized protein TNIN_182461 [Trichonephila inaurata madagascariensis]|uniref:Uncharacterized protein n=1 Tax=Trichonephila inaurata madagascariensis TaxID=2747483 RepID=A0A8X6XR14_9ARAC|nr:uncharacterized protein TNIN_182461 [Trichonephila inaurata madagascariensis]